MSNLEEYQAIHPVLDLASLFVLFLAERLAVVVAEAVVEDDDDVDFDRRRKRFATDARIVNGV